MALRTDVVAARGLPAPLFVLPNGAGIGYGEFHLDAQSLAWLSRHLPEIGDALTRGSAWVTLWDSLLDGELPSSRFLDLALGALPRETDELNVQRILSYLEHAYWTFTPDADRRARAPDVERVLRAGLTSAATPSLKGAYFAALARRRADTGDGRLARRACGGATRPSRASRSPSPTSSRSRRRWPSAKCPAGRRSSSNRSAER